MESLVQSAHKQLEYTPMPIAATFAGLHEFSKLKLFNNVTTGNGLATVVVPSTTTTMDAAKAVRYRECNRNHAINSGGHAVDGCGEFMPSGEDALRCAACDCHRNFHRKEVEGEPTCDCKLPAPIPRRDYAPAARNVAVMARGAGGSQPLALPSPAQIISRVTQSAPYQLLGLPPAGGGPGDSDDGDQGLSGSPSTIKKRFRTKFTTDQKERMGAFAEKLGWKIQKHDEAAVQEFCAEVGVKRHVLKVWMHNNKHTIGKKVE